MSIDKIHKTVRLYALQNAIQFNGKADSKAVIGKVIAIFKKDGFSPKEILLIVNSVIKEVNKIPLDKQIAELKKLAPELLKKEKKKEIFHCPSFLVQKKGK